VAEAPRIAIDAMGGDGGLAVMLAGVALARHQWPGLTFDLVGDEAKINAALDQHPNLRAASGIIHAPETIDGSERAGQAIRRAKSTSMGLAIDAVKKGRAGAAVSAGNTGALMAMAKVQLRTVPGLSRPAIAAIWPTIRGQSVVLDVGANIDTDARQLFDFALIGEAYARVVLGLDRPSVGLLNVGAEEMKGNEAVKAAAAALKSSGLPLRFYGFVEGDDISTGTVDVVVTSGFTGNIALKAAEGTARLIGHYIKSAMARSFLSRIGYVFARPGFNVLRQKLDPRAVNGGVFLGLNGVVVKSHGGTDGVGFATALDLAVEMGGSDFVQRVADAMANLPASALSLEGSRAEPVPEISAAAEAAVS
jgi:glycerol-3-phosphate acyltransferase PlsX